MRGSIPKGLSPFIGSTLYDPRQVYTNSPLQDQHRIYRAYEDVLVDNAQHRWPKTSPQPESKLSHSYLTMSPNRQVSDRLLYISNNLSRFTDILCLCRVLTILSFLEASTNNPLLLFSVKFLYDLTALTGLFANIYSNLLRKWTKNIYING